MEINWAVDKPLRHTINYGNPGSGKVAINYHLGSGKVISPPLNRN